LQAYSKKENDVVTGVMGGCLDAAETCEGDKKDTVGYCAEENGNVRCERCCMDVQLCNTYLEDPNSFSFSVAAHLVSSFILVMITMVTAIF
jgi:hypothetical protein